MKSIIPVLTLVFFVTAAWSQNEKVAHITIPKKASVIYIKPVGFDSVVNKLEARGFKIDYQVKNSIIVTKYRSFGDFFRHISLHIRYYDSTAEIMGTIYQYSSSNGRLDPVVTYSSMSKKAFESMNDFALTLNGKVWYEK